MTRARSIRKERHRWDWRKPDYPVGTVLLDRVDTGSSYDFLQLVPTCTPKAAFSSCPLETRPRFRIVHYRFPGLNRVVMFFASLSPEVLQGASDIRVFDSDRTIEVPGV